MIDQNLVYAQLNKFPKVKFDTGKTDQCTGFDYYIKEYTMLKKKAKDRYGDIKYDSYITYRDRKYKKLPKSLGDNIL